MIDDPDDVTVVNVALGSRAYDILVGDGLLAQAGKLLAPLLARPRVVVVTDETVAGLHLATLGEALDSAAIRHQAIVLPPGEATKDVHHLGDLLDGLLDREVERSDTVVAMGGGVIGDVAGFAASILRRGVGLVHLPTTLLAQVDSAIGGKTGINTCHGKNLVGSFHQPRLVVADRAVLNTLPERDLRAGYAEIVKYGLLGDADFFAWLEQHGAGVIAGDTRARHTAVATACRAKAEVVATDERETGTRAVLNLGHTFAHAVEAETGYNERLLHGEAVAIGMVMAFEMSARLGLCAAGDVARVRHHLSAVGLPTSPSEAGLAGWNTARLIDHMRQDKKVRDGKLTFVLVRGIGQAFVSREVDADDVLAVLEGALAA